MKKEQETKKNGGNQNTSRVAKNSSGSIRDDSSDNPRIRRSSFFQHYNNKDSNDNDDSQLHPKHNNRTSNNQNVNVEQRFYPFRKLSLADFQDGKRYYGAAESTSIYRETADLMQNVSHRIQGRLFSKKQSNCASKNDANTTMNHVRLGVGLYQNHPLANDMLLHSSTRETALQEGGAIQMNHVRGTDGWWRSFFIIQDRALDTILGPWLLVVANAILSCLLSEVWTIELPRQTLQQWETVYSLVVQTSLAFLLVFRLNRCAMRYWEARGLWGNVTHATRNLVGELLMYGSHSPKHRDEAIRWGASLCLATKQFIRSARAYNPDELAGLLTPSQVARLRDSHHAPLYAATLCRHHLSKLFQITPQTPTGMAHAYTIRLQECEKHVTSLIQQVSGMEKIRSTPLPIAYVAHLRTLLLAYLLFLPYVWVSEYSWSTIPFLGITAICLLGIEGASSEVEIPFSSNRPNHLALDAYCLVILDSVMGLVVDDANLHLQGLKGGTSDAAATSSARETFQEGVAMGSFHDSDMGEYGEGKV